MGKPVIAAVNGAAAGAGAALAYACDLRIAGTSASFSMAFAGVALSADSGASFTLPRLIGAGRASRMMLLGERVDAAEALRIGMVDEVVAETNWLTGQRRARRGVGQGPTRAYAWIKASMHAAATSDLAVRPGVREPGPGRAVRRRAITTRRSGAFAEKRPPRFEGGSRPAGRGRFGRQRDRRPAVAHLTYAVPWDLSENSARCSIPACATRSRNAESKANRREEEGNARDGDLRIDLASGVAVINIPGKPNADSARTTAGPAAIGEL